MRLTSIQWEELTNRLLLWVCEQQKNIGAEKAVIGVSGGKDSSVVAALAKKALGAERVQAVLLPRKGDGDIDIAVELCRDLDITYHIIDIERAYTALETSILRSVCPLSRQAELNMPPRLRMTALYAVAQSVDGVVWNTSNLSEDWVGYATIYGDTAGAFSPLATFTTDEVIALGRHLGLAEKYLLKPPADGLTGKTDEEVLGFSYDILNHYIRSGECEDAEVKEVIDRLHGQSRFKFKPLPMFQSSLPIKAEDISHIYDF